MTSIATNDNENENILDINKEKHLLLCTNSYYS